MKVAHAPLVYLDWNARARTRAAPIPRITAPPGLNGTSILFGTAAFGPAPTQANFSGNVVLGEDGVVGAGTTPGTEIQPPPNLPLDKVEEPLNIQLLHDTSSF